MGEVDEFFIFLSYLRKYVHISRVGFFFIIGLTVLIFFVHREMHLKTELQRFL